ncbi:hypothetical protein Tco_0218806 [Tanacetum coccineum]
MIKENKSIKEKDDPDVFVLPIRLEGRFDTHALADTGSNINIIPYRIFEELRREHVKQVSHNVSMLNHSKAEPMGMLKDILCQVDVTSDDPTQDQGRHFKAMYLCLDVMVLDPLNSDATAVLRDNDLVREAIGGPYGFLVKQELIEKLNHEAMSDPIGKLRMEDVVELIPKILDKQLEHTMTKPIYLPYVVDWGLLNNMGCAEEIEEMLEIKVCENDELRTKKIIKFRLGGGLRSDENFNARDYWLSISSEEELHLSRSLASTIRHPILRVLQKMITYEVCQRTTGYDKMQRNELLLMSMFEEKHQNGYVNVAWLMAKWLKRKGVGSQRDSMICCRQFIMRIAKRMGLLTDEVLNSLSASTYYRALDATTLRELSGPNERLIVEDPAPGVPQVVMPRGPCPSMQDLYDRMGNIEIRQGTYALQGAYALPRYDEEQQDDEE